MVTGNLIRCCLLTVVICGFACSEKRKKTISFQGENAAVVRADSMFKAIGGKEAWCKLKSLYIKAQHTEPQMPLPYTSEIWRAIDTFELVIEQQNDSFHVKAVITADEGRVRYYDKRDTVRIFSPEQLADWAYGHKHNVYVLLHDLACKPEQYLVEIDDQNRLTFYRDTIFEVSFGLDELKRPYLFYQPNPDGSVSGSILTRWGTDDGLVHSAGGHPLDSNFVYTTEIWIPSEKSLIEDFGKTLFTLDKP
ncbi:MAG: hypothetical protein ACR2MM_11105 [Flavobacteriaceae bacterium]